MRTPIGGKRVNLSTCPTFSHHRASTVQTPDPNALQGDVLRVTGRADRHPTDQLPPNRSERALPMNRLALLALPIALTLALAAAPAARAETKLNVQVFTASPQGFLVNSALVEGEKDAVLIDGQLTLSDAHRLAGGILDSKKNLTTIYVTH